jgi:hypothetical protein
LRTPTFLAILAGAFVATPFVVMAASGPGPTPAADLAPQAPPPAVVASAAPTPVERQPAACGRKVRVVYPGYQPPADASCGGVN